MSSILNCLLCFIPKSPEPTIEIDIIETPATIRENQNKFKSMDLRIDGKAKEILVGKK